MCAHLIVYVPMYKEDQVFFDYSPLNKAESLTLNSELTNMDSPGSQCDLGILARWLPRSGTTGRPSCPPSINEGARNPQSSSHAFCE